MWTSRDLCGEDEAELRTTRREKWTTIFHSGRLLETSLLPVRPDPSSVCFLFFFSILLFPCSCCSSPSLIQLWLQMFTYSAAFRTNRGWAVTVWAHLILHLQYIVYTVCVHRLHGADIQYSAQITSLFKHRCQHSDIIWINIDHNAGCCLEISTWI